MEIFSIVFIIYMIYFVISQFRKSDNPEGPQPATGSNGQHVPFATIRDSWLNNYNFRRASELMDSDDERQAFEYLKKALREDPNNAYAHSMMGLIYLQHQVYGTAINAYTAAIQNTPDSEHALFFVGRSRAYAGLGNEEARLADIRSALDVEPGNTSALKELVEYHYFLDEYDESDRVIDKLLESEPNDIFGYMAKGRNEMQRGNWEHARELFEYASGLDDTYGLAWSYKAEALMKLGKVSQAIDCVIKAFELADAAGKPDEKAMFVRDELARTSCDLFCLKLMAKVAEGSQTSKWWAVQGKVYVIGSRHAEAAYCYRKAHELDPIAFPIFYEAVCWEQAGNYAKAADLLKQALSEDPDNLQYKQHLTLVLAEQDNYDAAIAICDELIHLQPDMTDSHYNRARFKHILGRYEDAIEDYSTELALKDGDDAKSHLFRGMAYEEIGEVQKAREDYQAITDNADLAYRGIVLPLAYAHLGDHEKADEAWKTLEESLEDWQLPQQIQALVLGADFLARIGEMGKALESLREALELGSCRFSSYRRLPETSELRKVPGFEELLLEYEQKVRSSWAKGQEEPDQTSPREDKKEVPGMAASMIPFNKEGGVCKVSCKVNGLPLHFVFDTGASDVTISTVEATFMLKNGYLRKQDFSGTEYYTTASGEIAEGTSLRLREVDFGGVKLKNVKASVVRSQNAPLLLGQSVLQRLGKIEIDNDRNVIRIIRPDSQETIVTSTDTGEKTGYGDVCNPHASLESTNQTKQTSSNNKRNENS